MSAESTGRKFGHVLYSKGDIDVEITDDEPVDGHGFALPDIVNDAEPGVELLLTPEALCEYCRQAAWAAVRAVMKERN